MQRGRGKGGLWFGEGKMQTQKVLSFKSGAALTSETNWGHMAFLHLPGLYVPTFPQG